jgi:hypothetical protein
MRLWDAVKAAGSGVEDDGTYDAPNSAENCAARRAAAFRVTARDVGLPDDWGSKPFGVIIEMWGPRGVLTLAAFANGDASLLHEKGSGIIGRQNHVHVVNQAKTLVAKATGLEHLLDPTTTLSRPEPGSARIYFLTGQSLLATDVRTADARRQESPWFPLMETADELVSEFSQYLMPEIEPGPPRAAEFLRSVAMVVVTGGMTYAASMIPIWWIRWPLVGIGLFLTAAALFVFYLMLAGGRDDSDEGDAATAR